LSGGSIVVWIVGALLRWRLIIGVVSVPILILTVPVPVLILILTVPVPVLILILTVSIPVLILILTVSVILIASMRPVARIRLIDLSLVQLSAAAPLRQHFGDYLPAVVVILIDIP